MIRGFKARLMPLGRRNDCRVNAVCEFVNSSEFLSSGDHFLKAEIAGTTVVRSADIHMIVQRNLQHSRSLGDASG
jgi:hypothetical protein